MDIDDFLERARQSSALKALEGVQADGAESYLKAIDFIYRNNTTLPPDELRKMAEVYVVLTARPRPFTTPDCMVGVRLAKRVVARLQEEEAPDPKPPA